MKVEFNFAPVMDAITETIMKAQEKTDEHQISQVQKFFAKDGSPISQTINVKREKGSEKMQVPLISLMPPTAVKMKEVSLHVKVPIMKFTDDPVDGQISGEAESLEKEYMADLHITYEGIAAPPAFTKISELLTDAI
ncbi:MAG: DUF2589 domain-containing protein [Crocinitomicaceae bacterium]|nr:DUF2589 domain-containing protein [Crocinitomicaceae bacterium]